jgi:hypothetical protein
MTEIVIATLLYVLFTGFSAVGTYFMVVHYRSRQAGLVSGALVLLFFILLYVFVLAILPEGAFSPPPG